MRKGRMKGKSGRTERKGKKREQYLFMEISQLSILVPVRKTDQG
jgi:hypothetical protein